MKLIRSCCWLLFVCLNLLTGESDAASPVASPDSETVVYFDLTPLLKLDLNDPTQRRRFWDETHLVISLQGLVNRTAPRLFLRYVREPDDFWWEQITASGAWLAERKVIRMRSLDELLEHFRPFYRGAVVWDERVPATSNLASSIAGCDDLLSLRYDPATGSLYHRLTQGSPRLPVRVRLLREDGQSLFNGKGTIPGTDLETSGSAKNDAYRWLIEHYLKTGKADPHRLGYYLDGFWLRSWKAGSPVNHTLSNHDFLIARRGLIFDLNVWDDEACVDDPTQKPGTDVATLKLLLRAAWDQFNGRGVIHAAGFVPWAYKYTTHRGAGGRHDPVPTEWKYAEILSCYNAFMDADALGLSAMANASFYQHYPLADRYPQNPKPTRASLQARGFLDETGQVVPRRYVAHYVGDYDAAAWLYQQLPRMWRDPARGSTPLSWAFNPNLSERFPVGMAWARERRSTNDFFIAGDSGAGYINPGFLTEPRPHSGLPSGLNAWEEHCRRFYRQWDISVTGFIIDGYSRKMSTETLDAYARFSPGGIVAQKIPRQGVHGGMPFLRMRTDLQGSPAQAARTLHSLASGQPPQFVVARSILQTPSWYAAIERELAKLSGDETKVVDLHTLLSLVHQHEINQASVKARFASARQVSANPGKNEGLSVLHLSDGPFETVEQDGRRCWRLPRHQPPYYLYLDVADSFRPPVGGALELELEYFDAGQGKLILHYDSIDRSAPHMGAYKPHQNVIERTDSGQWRKARFRIEDGRFAGSQNGEADFRFYNAGDDLIVSSLRIRKD